MVVKMVMMAEASMMMVVIAGIARKLQKLETAMAVLVEEV